MPIRTKIIQPCEQLGSFLKGFLIFVLILALNVSIRLPDINMPLERDEGEYAYAAQEILRGALPYKDTFSQKPPLVFLWYMMGFKLFGATVVGIHIAMVIASALSAFGLYLLCRYFLRKLAKNNIAKSNCIYSCWFAAVVFSLSASGKGYFGSAANTEIFMLAPVIFGTLFILKALWEKKAYFWFFSGLFFGAAFMTKQVTFFSFLGPGFFAIREFAKERKSLRSYIKPLTLSSLGGTIVFLSFIIWFSAEGALRDFINVAFSHNMEYVGSPFGSWKWKQLYLVWKQRFFFSDGFLWGSMFISCVLILLPKRIRPDFIWFPILWFAGSLFGIALGPYTFGHYFLQVLPPLILMISILLYLVLERIPVSPLKRHILTVLMIFMVISPMIIGRLNDLGKSVEERSFELYSVYGPSPFNAAIEVGEYLGNTTGPGDRILIVGSEPEILFYSGRRSSTRYTIFYPLTGPFKDSDSMVVELFEEIERKPPMCIIFVYCRTSFITGGKSTQKLKRIFSRIELILKKKYFKEEDLVFTDIDGKVFWKKRDQTNDPDLIPLFHIFRRS